MNDTAMTADPVIGVYDTRSGAEAAMNALARGGFDMHKLSVFGKGSHAADEHPHGFYALGDRVKAWGVSGGFWGAAWALLLGSAVFVMPPFGIVAAAGPFAAALIAAFEGAAVVGGVSARSAALASVGVPHERALRYESDVLADRFLLIVHGSPDDVSDARRILAAKEAAHELPFHQAA
jgi:hypothetical protein